MAFYIRPIYIHATLYLYGFHPENGEVSASNTSIPEYTQLEMVQGTFTAGQVLV
jgi:hypothetical protein